MYRSDQRMLGTRYYRRMMEEIVEASMEVSAANEMALVIDGMMPLPDDIPLKIVSYPKPMAPDSENKTQSKRYGDSIPIRARIPNSVNGKLLPSGTFVDHCMHADA